MLIDVAFVAGATVAVAPGRRPRQHDAGPRGAHRRRDRCTTGRCGYFTPDEIAEAFAAARGVASPTQLRTVMKQDGRDLLAQFRAMAPQRRPISLQRWSVKRILLVVAVALGAADRRSHVLQLFDPDEIPIDAAPDVRHRRRDDPDGAVGPDGHPGAVRRLAPRGLDGGGRRPSTTGTACSGSTRTAPAGTPSKVSLLPGDECAVGDAAEVPSDEVGMRRFERPDRLPPGLRSTRFYVFDGGCATYRFAFGGSTNASLIFEVDQALAFQPRQSLVDEVARRFGLRAVRRGCAGRAPGAIGG